VNALLALVTKLAVLFGLVTVGPTGNLCNPGGPCNRPAAQVKLTFIRGGHPYTTRTTASGIYRIKLPPGIYTVYADTGITISPRRINVRRPQTKVHLAIDPGAR
jgi:hypothetical protein